MRRSVSRRGQSLVELALVLPVLAILLLGLLDLGRLFYVYAGITGAAGEGAAYGARIARLREPDTLEDEIIAHTVESTEGLVQITEDQVTVDPSPVEETSNAITVTVTYQFELITPLVRRIVSDGQLPLEAAAVQELGPAG